MSRARRIIENSFGILVARFRIYKRPINSTPDRVVAFVKATIVLHNFLRAKESSVYCPPQFTDGEDGEGNIDNGETVSHRILAFIALLELEIEVAGQQKQFEKPFVTIS